MTIPVVFLRLSHFWSEKNRIYVGRYRLPRQRGSCRPASTGTRRCPCRLMTRVRPVSRASREASPPCHLPRPPSAGGSHLKTENIHLETRCSADDQERQYVRPLNNAGPLAKSRGWMEATAQEAKISPTTCEKASVLQASRVSSGRRGQKSRKK